MNQTGIPFPWIALGIYKISENGEKPGNLSDDLKFYPRIYMTRQVIFALVNTGE
jgi:hypothetical protein